MDRDFYDKVTNFPKDDEQAYKVLDFFKQRINKKIPRQTLINAILDVKAKTYKNFFEEYNGFSPVKSTIEKELKEHFSAIDGR